MTPRRRLRAFRTRLICVTGTAVFLAVVFSGWPFVLVLLVEVAVVIAACWSLWRQQ